jgi:YidC/Oxa1 family membrane protein insertase
LVFLINLSPFYDVGIAIVALTIMVKFILFPFSHKSVVTQAKMRGLEPEISKIKEKHKKDQQQQARATMELYRAHGINPFSGCVMLLIQLPIIIALYKVFWAGLDFQTGPLYQFISIPEDINMRFLGLLNVSEKSYILAALAGASQFFQMKLAIPPVAKKSKSKELSFRDSFSHSMNIQMRYVMPVFVFLVALGFSSAVALYWTTMNLFAIVHEIFVRRRAKKLFLSEKENGGEKRDNQKNNRGNSGENDNQRQGGDL